MIIAVDFDGTIIEPIKYPDTNYVFKQDAEEALNILAETNTLILCTARYGWYFRSATKFIKKHKLPIKICKRKPVADIYIDDKNFGCHNIVWKDILNQINKGGV